MRRIAPPRPQCVEFTGQIIKIESHPVRLMRFGGTFDEPRKERQLAQQASLGGVVEPAQVRTCHPGSPGSGILGYLRELLPGVAENRVSAGVPVLDIEHRVVA